MVLSWDHSLQYSAGEVVNSEEVDQSRDILAESERVKFTNFSH